LGAIGQGRRGPHRRRGRGHREGLAILKDSTASEFAKAAALLIEAPLPDEVGAPIFEAPSDFTPDLIKAARQYQWTSEDAAAAAKYMQDDENRFSMTGIKRGRKPWLEVEPDDEPADKAGAAGGAAVEPDEAREREDRIGRATFILYRNPEADLDLAVDEKTEALLTTIHLAREMIADKEREIEQCREKIAIFQARLDVLADVAEVADMPAPIAETDDLAIPDCLRRTAEVAS
jgi:hypothetical protein